MPEVKFCENPELHQQMAKQPPVIEGSESRPANEGAAICVFCARIIPVAAHNLQIPGARNVSTF